MPIVNPQAGQPRPSVAAGKPPRSPFSPRPIPEREQPTLVDRAAAAFELENVAVALFGEFFGDQQRFTDNEAFDPRDHLRPDEVLMQQRFADVNSLEEMNARREQIRRERELQATLGSGGPVSAVALSMLAATADVTSLLPFFGGAGVSVARGLARGAASGAAINAAAEGVLQSTQETRDLSQSVANIIAGGAVGGGLGALGSAATGGLARRAADDHAANLRTNGGEPFTGGTAGAASVQLTPEMTRLVSSGGLADVMASLDKARLAPAGLKAMASNNPTTRDVAGQLVDTGLITEGNVRGFTSGAPIETVIKAERARATDTGEVVVRNALRDYRKRTRGQTTGTLSNREFREEVTKALRRNDTSPTPEVQAAAAKLRAEILDPFLKALQRAGLLPDDLITTTAPSYITRVYNVRKIKADRTNFEAKVSEWVGRSEALEEAEAKTIARDITGRILGSDGARVPFDLKFGPSARGSLKERTFNIPDELIEDFLVNDINEVLQKYLSTVVPDLAIVNRLRQFGDNPAKIREGVVAKIRDDGIAAGLPDAEIARDVELMENLLSLVQTNRTAGASADGAMQGAVRIARGTRSLNFITDLGSVLLSSVPDLGMQIAKEGTERFFKSNVATLASGFKSLRMAKREGNLAGTVFEIAQSTRMKEAFDVGGAGGSSQLTAVERGLEAGSGAFAVVNLLAPWTNLVKSMTSQMVATRIIESSRKVAAGGVEALSKGDRTRLARAGISPEMATRIAAQAQGEGVQEFAGGLVKIGDTMRWTDAEATAVFRNALVSDVDNVVVTPGSGDAPIWTSTEYGKTLFQYKRFMSSVGTRLMVSGVQFGEARLIFGLAAMTGLGMLGTAMRDIAIDGKVRERGVRGWIAEGADRSGMAGMFTEMDAMADELIGISAFRALSGEERSRYAGRNFLDKILGPSAGTVQDVAGSIEASSRALLFDDEFTHSDLHRIRRLVPTQNHFALRRAYDNAEEFLVPE